MRFKLPYQIISKKMEEIVARELRRLKTRTPKISGKNLKQAAESAKAIKTKGLPDNLVLKKLNDKLGYGIFLHPKAKPIERGDLIAPYSGVASIVGQFLPDDAAYAFGPIEDMHLTKEEQAHFDPKRRFHPRRLYSIKVDAEKQGNFTRFINHSSKPNVAAHLLSVPKNSLGVPETPLAIFYVAKKRIRPGEQLLICYESEEEKSYWGVFKIVPYPMFATSFTLTPGLRLKKNE